MCAGPDASEIVFILEARVIFSFNYVITPAVRLGAEAVRAR